MDIDVLIYGFREVQVKSGPNVGRKTLFFTVVFRIGENTIISSGWRVQEKKLMPPTTRLAFNKFLNLTMVDSAMASKIYLKLKTMLPEGWELEENINDAITLITARRKDVEKFCPELKNVDKN